MTCVMRHVHNDSGPSEMLYGFIHLSPLSVIFDAVRRTNLFQNRAQLFDVTHTRSGHLHTTTRSQPQTLDCGSTQRNLIPNRRADRTAPHGACAPDLQVQTPSLRHSHHSHTLTHTRQSVVPPHGASHARSSPHQPHRAPLTCARSLCTAGAARTHFTCRCARCAPWRRAARGLHRRGS